MTTIELGPNTLRALVATLMCLDPHTSIGITSDQATAWADDLLAHLAKTAKPEGPTPVEIVDAYAEEACREWKARAEKAEAQLATAKDLLRTYQNEDAEIRKRLMEFLPALGIHDWGSNSFALEGIGGQVVAMLARVAELEAALAEAQGRVKELEIEMLQWRQKAWDNAARAEKAEDLAKTRDETSDALSRECVAWRDRATKAEADNHAHLSGFNRMAEECAGVRDALEKAEARIKELEAERDNWMEDSRQRASNTGSWQAKVKELEAALTAKAQERERIIDLLCSLKFPIAAVRWEYARRRGLESLGYSELRAALEPK